MPESDISKMKVADLKRELKLRGLATTGNKNELQDRLQNALLDGDLTLEDTAISGEDLLDEVLTDEDEAKILGSDENELLQSPTATPITVPNLTSPTHSKSTIGGDGESGTGIDDLLSSSAASASKKIVLKRKNSFTTPSSLLVNSSTGTPTAKENTEPAAVPNKTLKMSERNPITINDNGAASTHKKIELTTADGSASAAATKISQLSIQERLEMRAKKFGINSASATSSDNGKLSAVNNDNVTDEKQIEMLKKRAERFGCVVSSKIAKIDAEEKLQKRKERFGGADGSKSSTENTTDVWAEKARLRLERFKTAPTNSASAVAAAAATATTAITIDDEANGN